jgi:adenylate kinase family enzyme
MQRIAIIGPAAAGKSSLALRLGSLLGIQTYHLDQLYWRPGYIATPDAEWSAFLDEIVSRPSWIIDGNFTASLPARLAAADTVLFLDLPRVTCVLSAIRRRVVHPLRRAPGMPEGCQPMFNRRFFGWIWTFHEDHRPYYLKLLAEPVQGRQVHVFRNRHEVRRFARSLESAQAG